MVSCVCVPVAIPVIFLVWSVCCGSHRCSAFEVSFSQWELMTVRREKDGKRRKRRDGWHVSFGWKRSLPRLSLLMVERSGTVFSARDRTCGQDQYSGGVRQTSRQCCKGSTDKRSRQRPGGIHRTRPHQAVVRTKVQWNLQSELHELREQVGWYGSDEKKQEVQRKPASEEGRCEEDGKMDVDEES